MIKIGDMVHTIKGAKYRGEVRALFITRRGKERCVVEAVDEDFEETLHVYPLEQVTQIICDHKHWNYKIHGRLCTCGTMILDVGD